VGLAWLLAHDPHILLIPGTSNLDHLAENVAAGDIRLGPETMSTLNGLGTIARPATL
jgi:pyridoxine 4-dehydrogenase